MNQKILNLLRLSLKKLMKHGKMPLKNCTRLKQNLQNQQTKIIKDLKNLERKVKVLMMMFKM